MRTSFVSAIALPVALLCGCGTPLVWRGPPGVGEQELRDVKRECLTRAESGRTLNMQVYDASAMDQIEGPMQRPGKIGEFYRSADQVFQQCMREQGYALVPRE